MAEDGGWGSFGARDQAPIVYWPTGTLTITARLRAGHTAAGRVGRSL
jgi:hypothetical protein